MSNLTVDKRVSRLLNTNDSIRPGDRFNQLTATGHPFRSSHQSNERNTFVVCRCDCGTVLVIRTAYLRSERHRPNTCGCRRHTQQWKHGEHQTRLFQIYNGIIQRCHNSNRSCYKDYGGRGILVCDEWRDDFLAFKSWSLANGYSDDLQIDRIDNDKGYSPDNCRWTTQQVNATNTRRNMYLTAFGETKCLSEWHRDRRCIVSYGTLLLRFKADLLSPEDMLRVPPRTGKYKRLYE